MARSADGRYLLRRGSPDPLLRPATGHHRRLLRFNLQANLVSTDSRQRRAGAPQSPPPLSPLQQQQPETIQWRGWSTQLAQGQNTGSQDVGRRRRSFRALLVPTLRHFHAFKIRQEHERARG